MVVFFSAVDVYCRLVVECNQHQGLAELFQRQQGVKGRRGVREACEKAVVSIGFREQIGHVWCIEVN